MSSSETVPAVLQVMPAQLQRFWEFFKDQDLSREDFNKVFFHLTRVSASDVGDDVIYSGSKEMKRTWNRTRTRGFSNIPMLVTLFLYFVGNLLTDYGIYNDNHYYSNKFRQSSRMNTKSNFLHSTLWGRVFHEKSYIEYSFFP